MEHTIPDSHLELLQEIWKALVQRNDPDATFVEKVPEEVPESGPAALGAKKS